MSIDVSVRGDMSNIINSLARLQRDVVDKAVPRALNKVADQVKTAAARSMRDAGYKLPIGIIKKGLSTYKASQGSLTAKVIASGRPIPLISYGARQTDSGVSVDVLNGRKMIPGAFIATMPSGHKGVYIRMGAMHKRVQKAGRVSYSGLPIKELFGPSVPNGLSSDAVRASLEQLIRDRFPAILLQQINYFVSRK